MSSFNFELQQLPPITVGVEIEFLLAYLYLDENDPDEVSKNQLPPVLRLPRSLDDDEWDDGGDDQKQAEEAIRDLLDANGFPVKDPKVADPVNPGNNMQSPEDLSNERLRDYQVYRVIYDSSLEAPGRRGFKYAKIEITTPVQEDAPSTYETLANLIKLISSSYRIIVNPSCGLHIHVGNSRAEYMPLASVKRLSAFLWAADPLLAMLHPPRRRWNQNCQSIRERSSLATGEDYVHEHDRGLHDDDKYSIWDCVRYAGADVRFGEQSTLWRECNKSLETIAAFEYTRRSGCFEPFMGDEAFSGYDSGFEGEGDDDPYALADELYSKHSLAWKNFATDAKFDHAVVHQQKRQQMNLEEDRQPRPHFGRTRKLPRLCLPKPTQEQISRYEDEIAEYGGTNLLHDRAEQDLGVYPGVAQIFEAISSCEIHTLLSTGTRPNYNFTAYRCSNMGYPATEAKRTVEWREAEGSLDPAWVATWCRIAVGLSKFAIHASVSEFLQALDLCDRAKKQDGECDAIDLLDFVGLFAEAEQVEQRMREFADKWELKYVGEP